ncbi:TrbI/VirB10 family protein [Polaromonas sp. JS666]|uniref:TrbI/VirB10 family protein n=1 Tax=Polaromonas sp. (strain JS666 / ATCC BAA-500) TaxID=296591 RepID=UPI0000532553|nr:TrbI/VirB10 family protein [Polaromonas sp. JS666]ABE47309.1 conjugation TrbI-like protein [Polaromonas sp. JS666]
MADNLLSPKTTAPTGVPPKNILAFLGIGILLAIGCYSWYSDVSTPTKGEDASKKVTLQEATAAKDAGVKGDPKDVTAFADKAGVPAALRGDAAAKAPLPSASAPDTGVRPQPFPVDLGSPPASSKLGTAASLEAVRETEISNAKPVVFDQALAPAQAPSEKLDPISQLIEQEKIAQARREAASAKAGDLSQVSGLLNSQRPQQAPAGRAADKSWLKEFAPSRKDPGLLPSLPEAPLMLTQGSVIEAVTLREINSDLPGVITARTTRDIYDSTTQRNLVLPKGTLAIGEYSSDVRMGQERLLFAFTRLVLPNGQSFDLGSFNGGDAAGRAGVKGDVDNHYFRLFGTSLLIGLLADRVVSTKAVPQGTNGQAGGLSATGQILTDTAKSILERNREVAPTISIPSGARVVIEVRRDMLFPSPFRG